MRIIFFKLEEHPHRTLAETAFWSGGGGGVFLARGGGGAEAGEELVELAYCGTACWLGSVGPASFALFCFLRWRFVWGWTDSDAV